MDNMEFMPPKTVMHVGLNASSKLDIYQRQGIQDQLKIATQQLEDSIKLQTLVLRGQVSGYTLWPNSYSHNIREILFLFL